MANKILFTIIIFFLPQVVNSQTKNITYNGFAVNEPPENLSTWTKIGESFYRYTGIQLQYSYFDFLIFSKKDAVYYHFFVRNPEKINFKKIYSDLSEQFGKEDTNKDYLAETRKKVDQNSLQKYLVPENSKKIRHWKLSNGTSIKLIWVKKSTKPLVVTFKTNYED